MKFTTPCFVRVEDAKKRKKLIGWLQGIGYSRWNPWYSDIWAFDDIDGAKFTSGIFIEDYAKPEFTDCSTNIKLFRALAAMNDENDFYQWFVCTSDCWIEIKRGEMTRNDGPQDHRLFFEPLFRKATAAEIIEHFKNKGQ